MSLLGRILDAIRFRDLSLLTIDEDNMISDSDQHLPTQQSVKAYVDAIGGGLSDPIAYDASTNTPDLDTSPSGISAAAFYYVTVAGTFFTEAVHVDDHLIAKQDNPTLESHWIIAHHDTDDGVAESSGITSGGKLAVVDGTHFSVVDGGVQFVTPLGARTTASWSGQTNVVATYVASGNNISYVGAENTGSIVQSNSAWTDTELKTIKPLGVLVHVNQTTLNDVNNEQVFAANAVSQLHQLANALGFFNANGNEITAGTNQAPENSDMVIRKLAGEIHVVGAGYTDTDGEYSPNIKSLPDVDNQPFQIRYSDGTSGTNDILLFDPELYEIPVGTPVTKSGTKYGAYWVFLFPSGNVKIMPPQKEHNDLKKAREGIVKNPFVIEPSLSANGLLRGWIVVAQDETDLLTALANGDAEFIDAGKFGLTTGVGGVSVVSDASETVKGIIELSTQAETDTATDDLKALTAAKLKAYANTLLNLTEISVTGNITSTAGELILGDALNGSGQNLIQMLHLDNEWQLKINSSGEFIFSDKTTNNGVLKLEVACDSNSLLITPTGLVALNDVTALNGDFITALKTPSSASDTGTEGTIAYDTGFIYICTATDTWKRVAIATW